MEWRITKENQGAHCRCRNYWSAQRRTCVRCSSALQYNVASLDRPRPLIENRVVTILDLSKLYQVDDSGLLFISPVIKDWAVLEAYGIDTVIDLEGGLDECIPTAPDQCLYVYFPIYDEALPNLRKLEAVAELGAHLVEGGHRV